MVGKFKACTYIQVAYTIIQTDDWSNAPSVLCAVQVFVGYLFLYSGQSLCAFCETGSGSFELRFQLWIGGGGSEGGIGRGLVTELCDLCSEIIV